MENLFQSGIILTPLEQFLLLHEDSNPREGENSVLFPFHDISKFINKNFFPCREELQGPYFEDGGVLLVEIDFFTSPLEFEQQSLQFCVKDHIGKISREWL